MQETVFFECHYSHYNDKIGEGQTDYSVVGKREGCQVVLKAISILTPF